ncbi:RND family efflux transporter MFP subunit [Anaerobacterium chartisolvens]|uniref:RND family efflux transporter MFP subunit n=1 Tax=Anaerobacterium chartisolvens TaxID=1297424 RepID=A0A369AS80_9FIRM|nr:HlyD family efflux transporter periplasmic adaptor subunit [Anaerobacterium chartisolvens]RCX12220.1 RND family efflux transporter MFP subunit [Anaerobacterium chartisolvens]
MKKKVIIGSVIGVVIVAFIVVNIFSSKEGSPAFSGGNAIRVTTESIQKGDISSYISANGVVEEIEKAEGYFDTALKVEAILVGKNEKISKGQKIIEVNLDDLNSQLEQLKVSKATQELSIKKIRAHDSKASVQTSERVEQNNVENAQNAYNEALKNYNSSKALLEGGSISQSDFDNAAKILNDAEVALVNAKLKYESTVDSNKSSLKSEALDLESEQQTLKATMLKIEDMEKKIKKINDMLLSPIDGFVSELNVEKGSYINASGYAYKVVNPDKLRIKAKVSEFNVKNVKPGQNAFITGDSIDKDVEVKGKVLSVSPTATKIATSNGEETVIEVLLSIDNAGGSVRPGINVTCDIYTVEKKDVLVANLNMIDLDKDDNKFVYLANRENSTMKRVPVKLGITSDMSAEIIEGLKEGDEVVLDPQPTFKDGLKITITGEGKK